MRKELLKYQPIAEGLIRLLEPYAEIVLHDLESGKIAGIYNKASKRTVGDDSMIEVASKELENNVLGPYEKVGWDGRLNKSISIVLRDEQDGATGLLCINLDISDFERMRGVLDVFLRTGSEKSQPEALFRDDWREKINEYVSSYLSQHGLPINGLKSQNKRELIQQLWEKGAFKGKNAANYIASVLSISRASVYQHLRIIKAK